MDDHTFFLVRQVDDQIRRTELLIEQQRLHIMSLHPSRRRNDEIKLKSLMSDYTRLLNYLSVPGHGYAQVHRPAFTADHEALGLAGDFDHLSRRRVTFS